MCYLVLVLVLLSSQAFCFPFLARVQWDFYLDSKFL